MNIEDCINRKDLNERLDGDIDLYRELAEIFINDSKTLLQRIRESIDTGNAQQLYKSAHTLKGAVSNFSAQKAYDAALALEIQGKENTLENAGPSYDDLTARIDELITAMTLLMNEPALN